MRLGLAWLAARGHIRITGDMGDDMQLAPGDGLSASDADFKTLDARLRTALAETAAYRAYFRSADKDALLRGYEGRAT